MVIPMFWLRYPADRISPSQAPARNEPGLEKPALALGSQAQVRIVAITNLAEKTRKATQFASRSGTTFSAASIPCFIHMNVIPQTNETAKIAKAARLSFSTYNRKHARIWPNR